MNTWITTHLLTQEGWKFDPQRTVYQQSGHLSTIDRAQVTESLPARDRHPNH